MLATVANGVASVTIRPAAASRWVARRSGASGAYPEADLALPSFHASDIDTGPRALLCLVSVDTAGLLCRSAAPWSNQDRITSPSPGIEFIWGSGLAVVESWTIHPPPGFDVQVCSSI